MASVRKRQRSPYYFACYRDQHGQKRQVSTRECNRNRALKWAIGLEEACHHAQSREALLVEFNRLCEDLFGQPLRVDTTRAFLKKVAQERTGEIAGSSSERYQQVVAEFLTFLGPKADAPLRDVQRSEIIAFRTAVAERTTASTANAYIKSLKGFFSRALEDHVVFSNVTKNLKHLAEEKASPERQRQPFSAEEISKLIAAAKSDPDFREWVWMIQVGALTGQRLGDIATMRWDALKAFSDGIVTWQFKSGKTKRPMSLPFPASIVSAMSAELGTGSTGKSSQVFPGAGACYGVKKRTNTLSNQFYRIMVKAGIVPPRDHKAHSKGRGATRRASTRGFHCLRHTTSSVLYAVGAPRPVVMDYVGHETGEISDGYSHAEMLQKIEAMERVVAFTGLAKASSVTPVVATERSGEEQKGSGDPL
jgi:integrase